MLQNQSMNQVVWRLLQKDLAIQKDLSRDLLNMRAVAKYLITNHELSAGLDAVVSAIRRFQNQNVYEEEEKSLRTIFQDAIVSTRNNISCLTTRLSFHGVVKKLALQPQVLEYRLVAGKNAVKIMVETPQVESVKALFSADEVEKVDDGLSEIAIIVASHATKTKGVIARMTNEIALANINMYELVVVTPEFFVYVKEKDIVPAHESILKLCHSFSSSSPGAPHTKNDRVENTTHQ